MTTQYPAAIDALQNPQPSTPTNQSTLQHAAQHSNLNSAVIALQTKVGVDAQTDPGSIDYRLNSKINLLQAPETLTQPGAVGDFAVDETYLYVCIQNSVWQRIAHGVSQVPQATQTEYQVGDVITTTRQLSEPTWLLCDGAVYLQSQYPQLFQIVGAIPDAGEGFYTYDPLTQFVVPNISIGVSTYIRATV